MSGHQGCTNLHNIPVRKYSVLQVGSLWFIKSIRKHQVLDFSTNAHPSSADAVLSPDGLELGGALIHLEGSPSFPGDVWGVLASCRDSTHTSMAFSQV